MKKRNLWLKSVAVVLAALCLGQSAAFATRGELANATRRTSGSRR